MKNAIFSSRISNVSAFVVMSGVLFVWLAVCPSAAQASPITYRIDYTLLNSNTTFGPTLPQAPLPTTFTYDPSTDLFNGLSMVWPSSTWTISFGFSASCGGFPWCGPAYDVNALTDSFRQSYLSELLNGGTWSAGTTAFGIDAQVSLGSLNFFALSVGNNMGDFASGTFTTTNTTITQAPEPSSLILLGAGLASIIAVKLRKPVHSSL